MESREVIQGNEFPTQFLFLEKEIPTCRGRAPSSQPCMPPTCLWRLSHPSSIRSLETGMYWVNQPFVGFQDPSYSSANFGGGCSGARIRTLALMLVQQALYPGVVAPTRPLFIIVSPAPPLPSFFSPPPPCPHEIYGGQRTT